MTAPTWLTATFAVLMLTVALYCTTRLLAARRWRRPTHLDTDAAHIVMGTAMAGMLMTQLRLLPLGAWELVFAAGAAWFIRQLIRARPRKATPWRCHQPVPHLVECAAMFYMFTAAPRSGTPSSTAMASPAAMASPGGRYPVLALALAVFMFAYVVRTGDHLTTPSTDVSPATTATPAAPAPLAPRCAALCKIAMGLTMSYTLILML